MNRIILLIAAMIMTSCSIKQKDVQKTEHLSKYYQVKRDSIFIYHSDSVLIEKRGDTVFIDKVKWRYKDRFLVDTVRVTDTVYKDKIKEVLKEKTVIPGWMWLITAIAVIIIVLKFKGK